jgi:uncharacterized protein (TIGR00251 family)
VSRRPRTKEARAAGALSGETGETLPSGKGRERPALPKDGLVVNVQVVPRASRNRIGPLVGDRLKIQVTAPPVDGAANQAVVAALAEALGVPRRAISIIAGHAGRKKTVRLEGVSAAALDALTGPAPEGTDR